MSTYDLILSGGTVLDPKNGLDVRADIGIVDGRIERVESELDPTTGADIIDVEGKWVMPGQID
ncbi:MAG TPA: amidohydrolase/deacetylase family metallohydrolase, partial [SAR202 cluster bacterium]|nr:amidohydrolase/deacetylase family metallohydrolase [SAR202 cluster bacterium]